MATTPLFIDGQESSASALMANMQAMIDIGQQIVDTMQELQTSSLEQIQRDLSRLQGYGCQVLRAPQSGIAAAFLVSDFLNTDQTRTNATVRADSASVTLRERKNPGTVLANTITFSSNSGTVEQFGPFYRVSASAPPIGTFDIKLAEPTDISFLIIDFAPTPSIPNISVKVSQNGLTYTSALQITTSGYRASVWITPQEVQYIQVVFSPTHPDTLGGSTYTFGINDFYAYSVEFQLQSDWYSLPLVITPTSAAWVFNAPDAAGLTYFLSLDGGTTWQEVIPGQQIPVPGATRVSVTATLPSYSINDGVGLLNEILPVGTIPSTVLITFNGAEIPLAPGLPLEIAGLTNTYIVPEGLQLYILPVTTADYGNQYQLSYVYIPADIPAIQAILHVQLNTEDKANTPVFTGATLENV